jgi:hypothetical protein
MKIYSFVKITILLLILLIVLPNNSHGQDLRKFRINLQSGLALPYGQLASKNFSNGGYAVYGTGSSAEAIWQFNKQLSAGVAFSMSEFPFDENTYAQDLVDDDVFMDNLYMKSDPFEVLTYTTAMYYSGAILKKIQLSGKLGGGIIWAQTPDQLFSATYFGGIKRTYKVTPSRDTKPVLTTGITCHYQLFEHVDVLLFADYYLADMGFNFRTATTTYTRWLTFSYINAGIGIGFVF